jgi:hypothetical protein
MSKVRALGYDLATRAPSEEETSRRREATGPRTGLVGDLYGRLLAPAPVPTKAPHVAAWADETTID